MKKLLFFVLVVLIFSCEKDHYNGSVNVQMNHQVDGKDLRLNEYLYSGSGHSYQVTKLWYYISDITFIGDGVQKSYDIGKLIKFEDLSTHLFTFDSIPMGRYNQMKFHFGFENSKNRESYLSSTIDNQNMFWPTQLGPGDYHYMKYEGKYDSLQTGTIKNFMIHCGPTYGKDYSFEVSLDISEFEINRNSHTISLDVDMHEWIENPRSYDFKDYLQVMMNHPAQTIYQENAKSAFSFNSVRLDE